MRRYDKREKLRLRVFVATCAVGTIAMAGALWATLVTRPAAYETLRNRGVLAAARPHCDGDNCTLTYVYAGRTHENPYGNEHGQFRGIRPVAVLVDPQHPGTMYTVHDVQRNTNAGLGGFGVFCILLAAGFAGGTFWFGRELRGFVPITASRPEPDPSAPASARAAWLAVDAIEDALYDGTAPAGVKYRFDPDELGRAFDNLRERLAAMPGLEPEWREIPRELSERVRGAKRTPFGGGVRLDPAPVFFELARLRSRIAVRALRPSAPAADPR